MEGIQSMTKNLIKLSIAIVIIAGIVGSSFSTRAYPPFLRKAQKFGAKNCLYCHKEPEGGEGWNERGEWLIAEKERRKADAVDPEWLADYKEGAKKDAENKEGAKKDAENKEGAKKDAENKEENKEESKKKEKPNQ